MEAWQFHDITPSPQKYNPFGIRIHLSILHFIKYIYVCVRVVTYLYDPLRWISSPLPVPVATTWTWAPQCIAYLAMLTQDLLRVPVHKVRQPTEPKPTSLKIIRKCIYDRPWYYNSGKLSFTTFNLRVFITHKSNNIKLAKTFVIIL